MPTISEDGLYTYKAKITGVYDGDTVTADIDMGLKVWAHGEKLRLSRINCPELRGDEREQGLLSRDWLREQLLNKEVLIQTAKDKKGKYGRYLAEIYLNGVNINDLLVTEGLAEHKEY